MKLPLFFFEQLDPPGGAVTPPVVPPVVVPPIVDPATPPALPDPLDPAPPVPVANDVIVTLAAALGVTAEELKARLVAPAVASPAEAAPPVESPAPDDANLTDLQKEQRRADQEKARADGNDSELRRYKTLEAADVEAAALGLTFHPGALAKLHKAGDFDEVAFDAKGAPQNVRKTLEAIAAANPWALKTPGAVDTDARNFGKGTHLISDDELAEAARKYGVSR